MAEIGSAPASRGGLSRRLRLRLGGGKLMLAIGLALPLAVGSIGSADAGTTTTSLTDVLPDARAQARVKDGKVEVKSESVVGSDHPRAVAVGLIDADPAAVWAVIEDCGNYAGRLPRISKSASRKKHANTRECEVTIDFPSPISDARVVTKAVDHVTPGQRWHRSWTLIEGDFSANSGSWTLVPFDGQTLAIYEVHAAPMRKISPGLQRLVQQKTIPALYQQIGELARTGR